MDTYYTALISRNGDNVSVRLESSVGGSKWGHLVTKPAHSIGHGQEIAEQMRLARDASHYSFAVTIDCR
jgi:hypothetical protein